MPINILFVGSNPSNASLTDLAFHDLTKSSKILTEWSKDIVGTKIYINVADKKTEKNRALTMKEIEENLSCLKMKIDIIKADRVIALGKTATKALTLLGVSFYEMPHPSGMNRLLNDKNYAMGKVKDLQSYCSEGLIQNTLKTD